jgi:DNA-binding transcriptional regulator/RsmH inhibitor MraZ
VAVDQETPGPVGDAEHPRGLFKASVDSKGRLKLPAAFQKYFESLGIKRFYITTRDERLVYIAPLDLWKKFETVLDHPENEEEAKVYDSVRFTVDKYGSDATSDGEGRLLLSQELRQKFSLMDATVWLQFKKGAVQMYSEAEYKAREIEVNKETLAKAGPNLALKGF